MIININKLLLGKYKKLYKLNHQGLILIIITITIIIIIINRNKIIIIERITINKIIDLIQIDKKVKLIYYQCKNKDRNN